MPPGAIELEPAGAVGALPAGTAVVLGLVAGGAMLLLPLGATGVAGCKADWLADAG